MEVNASPDRAALLLFWGCGNAKFGPNFHANCARLRNLLINILKSK
jgi:hypothetical protein